MSNQFLPLTDIEATVLATYLEKTLADDAPEADGSDEPFDTLMGLLTRLRTGLVETTSVENSIVASTVHGSNFQIGVLHGSYNHQHH